MDQIYRLAGNAVDDLWAVVEKSPAGVTHLSVAPTAPRVGSADASDVVQDKAVKVRIVAIAITGNQALSNVDLRAFIVALSIQTFRRARCARRSAVAACCGSAWRSRRRQSRVSTLGARTAARLRARQSYCHAPRHV